MPILSRERLNCATLPLLRTHKLCLSEPFITALTEAQIVPSRHIAFKSFWQRGSHRTGHVGGNSEMGTSTPVRRSL